MTSLLAGRTAGSAALTVLTVFAWGCGEVEPVSELLTEARDSSGVEIVTSGGPMLSGNAAWSVGSEPTIQIGSISGDEAYLFSSVWSAVRLSDGRLVVSDRGAMDVRVFDARGRHQVTFGGRGDGPEEFGGPPWLAVAAPDTLVIWDPGHYRLSWYDPVGTLIRQENLLSVIGELQIVRFVNGLVWQVRSDGVLLWTGPADVSRPGEGLSQQARRMTSIEGSSGASVDFGLVADGESYYARRGDGAFIGYGNDLAPREHGALGPAPHHFTRSSAGGWEVRLYGAGGGLLRVLRAPIGRFPVTSEVVAARRDRLSERLERASNPPATLSELDRNLPVPDSLSAIGSLMWDTAGRLWVGRRQYGTWRPEQFDVFDPDGRWLTSVRIPESLGRILEIGHGYLLARWQDDLDVSYLRMHAIDMDTR